MSGKVRWKLIGIDFHDRWRGGQTRLDLNGDSLLVHHGFYSLEWARGPHVGYFKMQRRADAAMRKFSRATGAKP